MKTAIIVATLFLAAPAIACDEAATRALKDQARALEQQARLLEKIERTQRERNQMLDRYFRNAR